MLFNSKKNFNIKTRKYLIKSYLSQFINETIVQLFINVCVIVNILILCLDTYKVFNESYHSIFMHIDQFCLHVFFVEFLLKFIVLNFNYFRSIWNLIDFITLIFGLIDNVIVIAKYLQLPTIFMQIQEANLTAITTTSTVTSLLLSNYINNHTTVNNRLTSTANKHGLLDSVRLMRLLRLLPALRALRILKTVKLFTSLQIIIKTCINSFQSMGAIIILMSLILYLFAVIGCGLFHKVDDKYFGSLFDTMFTLVQIITLDDWYTIYKVNKLNKTKLEITLLILFLFIYILIEYYILLNLFLAVLVDNFQTAMKNFKLNERKNHVNNIKKSKKYESNREHELRFNYKKYNNNNKIYDYNMKDNEEDEESEDGDEEENINSVYCDVDSEDEFDKCDNFNEIYGQFHPYSQYLDPTISLKQRQLIERHLQLLNTIEYYSYEKQKIFRINEYLIEKTTDDDDDDDYI